MTADVRPDDALRGVPTVPTPERGDPVLTLLGPMQDRLQRPEAVHVRLDDGREQWFLLLTGSPDTSVVVVGQKRFSEDQPKMPQGKTWWMRVAWIDRRERTGGFVQFSDSAGGKIRKGRDPYVSSSTQSRWFAGGAVSEAPWTIGAEPREGEILSIRHILDRGAVDQELTEKCFRVLNSQVSLTRIPAV